MKNKDKLIIANVEHNAVSSRANSTVLCLLIFVFGWGGAYFISTTLKYKEFGGYVMAGSTILAIIIAIIGRIEYAATKNRIERFKNFKEHEYEQDNKIQNLRRM